MPNHFKHARPSTVLQRRRKLRSWIMTALFALVIVFLLFQLGRSHAQRTQLHHQLVTTQTSFNRQHRHYRHLKLSVHQLSNREYLEQLIRQRFYYHKPGETVYRLPGEIAHDVVNK